MKSLLEVLEEIANYHPDVVLTDRAGTSLTIKQWISMIKRGKVKPKASIKKKQFFGGMTAEGKVSVARSLPGTGSAAVLLEDARPHKGPPYVAIDFE